MSSRHKHPLFVLAEIDQLYRSRNTNDEPQETAGVRGLGVLISQKHFIFNSQNIVEISRIDKNRKISPIPSSLRWHKGLMSVRGQLVNIIDLSAYLMDKTTEINTKTRIIIVDRGDFHTGFLVNEVLGLLKTDTKEKTSTIDTILPGKLANACRRSLLIDNTVWTELDLDQLYSDPEFSRTAHT